MDDPGPVGRQLLLQFLLIFINAFFAASEIAVVSLNGNKLRKMAEDGSKSAVRLLKLVDTPTVFLSAIQIGITLAGFLGSAFAAQNFSDRLVVLVYDTWKWQFVSKKVLASVSVVVITLILSFFTLVLGELVPKRVAMHAPLQVAKFTAPVVRAVAFVMKPTIWLLSVSTAGVLRIFGIKDKGEREQVTEDDIRLMADVGEETGAIDTKEREYIDNIFEFDNSTAKDVMTRASEVVTVNETDSVEDITKCLNESGFSRVPVWDRNEENIIGILMTKEFLLNLRSPEPLPLKEILREPYFVPETVTCDKLFSDMQENKDHMAIVIDEYGAIVGVVTMEDLIEEILGNIYDESDDAEAEEEQIVQIDENKWRVAGNAELDEVFEKIGMDMPDDIDANTMAGLVIACLTEIPDDGTVFEVESNGLHITVDRFFKHRMESGIVEKIPDGEKSEEEKSEEDKSEK